MANEINTTDLTTNGGMVAEILSSLIHEQLYDATDLRSVMRRIEWQSAGSTVLSVTKDQTPGAFATVAESVAAANTAYTTSEFSLTVARYARMYEITDLTGVAGARIDLDHIVNNLMSGVALTITDLLCALFPALAQSVGTTTVDLSVDDLYDAQFQLNSSNVQGGYSCVLHPQQMNDFRSSLRGETGSIQFTPATAEMLSTKGPGFQGSWNGIEFWQSDSVTTVGGGADRSGAMFGEGCFAYTEAPVALVQGHIPAQNILVNAGELIVELSRNAEMAESAAVAHYYPAVVECEDLRGVEIITDA